MSVAGTTLVQNGDVSVPSAKSESAATNTQEPAIHHVIVWSQSLFHQKCVSCSDKTSSTMTEVR